MIGFPGCVVDSSCQIHITDYEKAIQLLTVNAQFLYTETFLNKYNKRPMGHIAHFRNIF